MPTIVVLGYVTLIVYVPLAAELEGRNPSPEPETNAMEKLAFWLVPVESTMFQVAPWVMSPPGDAVALKNTVDPPAVTDWLDGVTVIDDMFDITTETVAVPVHAEHPPDEAVMVDVPDCSPVTMPEVCPTDTTVGVLEDQTTPEVRVFWLPSLKVPVAVI